MKSRTLIMPTGACLALLLFGSLSSAKADLLHGVGVIGDSFSDEHRFESYSYSCGWVEQLATYRSFNFGTFSTSSRGEPRRAGYKYNWARSGHTSAQMISTGQNTGLAGQVAARKVSLAIASIGWKYRRSFISLLDLDC